MLFFGPGSDSNTDFGPPHVVEQLSFSMISSILTSDHFFTFRGPGGLFLGSR